MSNQECRYCGCSSKDQYRAELYDEVWQNARSMGYGNVTDALSELERFKLAQAAAGKPAAVVEQTDYPYPVSSQIDVPLPVGTQLYTVHQDAWEWRRRAADARKSLGKAIELLEKGVPYVAAWNIQNVILSDQMQEFVGAMRAQGGGEVL